MTGTAALKTGGEAVRWEVAVEDLVVLAVLVSLAAAGFAWLKLVERA